MAALTADVHIPHLGTPDKLGIKAVGADTFFAGALVFGDGTNGKAQVVPATGDVFLGICAKQKVVAAADEIVEVYVNGVWGFAFTGAAEGDVGEFVCVDVSVASDNEADLLAFADLSPATNDLAIGRILAISIGETTRGWVSLIPGGQRYRADTGTGDVEWL